jgi:hypothetical protein
MVATTTVAATAAIAGAMLIVGQYLVYAFGKYRHAAEPGVVDMNDYRNTRLQIRAVNESDPDGSDP